MVVIGVVKGIGRDKGSKMKNNDTLTHVEIELGLPLFVQNLL